ncbi:3949_t:CDS:2, partial [Acaulospora morrowiae]
CLIDEELAFLGAPWPRYCELAQRYNLQIIRIPMIEGPGCNTNGTSYTARSKGVGRAGLVACCWLLRTRLCHDADRAIRLVRMRRSPKAIETMQQVDFIVKYADYSLWKIQERSRLSYDVLNDVTHNNIVT